jgi:hypothetical protein
MATLQSIEQEINSIRARLNISLIPLRQREASHCLGTLDNVRRDQDELDKLEEEKKKILISRIKNRRL